MEVKLIVLGGKNPGKKVPIPGPKFFIGRSEDCHLRPQSDLVSRHHCVILLDEAYVAIRDFGSRNGTFVNDERVLSETELKNGDHLKVGPLEFEVELAVAVGGKKKPKVRSVQEAAARTVGAAAADDEPDISDWLGDDDADALSTTQAADATDAGTTSTIADAIKDTTTIPTPSPAPKATPPETADRESVRAETPTEPPQPETPAPEEYGPKRRKKSSTPGGMHRRGPEPTSADSREAADEMLRHLFGRKR